ncbi:hypothetical protein [Dokdonia sp.]|uniref:hypothetical protein n=1 Tax=Dokdonia sp. TaxID=2024995 RepID=UPI003265058E
MKNTILKFTFLLFTFILTISCSVEQENAPEQELITANLFGDQTETPCIDPNLDTDGYGINIFFIEYEPGLTREEKQVIRAPYCGSIISIELCDMNPNAEIWTVRGPCHNNGPLPLVCQPGMIPPVDPDLKQASHASDCRNTGMTDIDLITN